MRALEWAAFGSSLAAAVAAVALHFAGFFGLGFSRIWAIPAVLLAFPGALLLVRFRGGIAVTRRFSTVVTAVHNVAGVAVVVYAISSAAVAWFWQPQGDFFKGQIISGGLTALACEVIARLSSGASRTPRSNTPSA
jgi:hypothetical protein